MENKKEILDRKYIRNFSIIAHIDHGKSTLADRILEYTKALSQRDLQDQFLDKMDLERERGITIKAQTVTIDYLHTDKEKYALNLIDTPGHVDFHYEVSRSLAACEGALLVVDASQGVQAQTLANVYLAIENDLEIITVLNKVDLDSADPERVLAEIEDIIGIDTSNAVKVSAKTGEGVPELLEKIINLIPAPKDDLLTEPFKGLVYDSWFDSYLGVVAQIKVVQGSINSKSKVHFLATKTEHEIYKLGKFNPGPKEFKQLSQGEVGYLSASIKNIEDVKIGDTVVIASDYKKNNDIKALGGFKDVKPMVFGGLFPVDSDDYESLKAALEKLRLNDASFSFEAETSVALGFGYRCGYLGLLHMEIIQERLEREFNLDLITTAPSVVYRVTNTSGEVIFVDNPSELPEIQFIDFIEEPIVEAVIHCPKEYLGNVLTLCEDKRGVQKNISFHGEQRAVINYELPLNEIVLDFHDRLKSKTKGYASFDYEFKNFSKSKLVKLDIKINGEDVDALSIIVHKDHAFYRGRELCKKLKELINRQMFDVAIQAAIGAKILARESVKALRKNVTAKCYGGDISRKRKLLEKQKKGKKRMKNVGKVSIPQEAFLAVLKLGE